MKNCLVMGAAGYGGFLSGSHGIDDGALGINDALVMSCGYEERANA